MKQLSWLVSLLVLAFVFPGCREDEHAKPGKIRFAFNPTVVADGQGRKTTSLPDGASLYVSIRRISGNEVYSLEPVRLLKLGDAYISEPLALEGGNYELTDFLVADGNGDVVYATPKEGSEFAPWVDDPLPQAFSVSDDNIVQVNVQVLPVDAHLPEQFGYVTFGVQVAPFPYFKLAVFRQGGAGPEFSRVHAYLLDEGDTVYHRHLPASINDVIFPGSPERTYTLVLMEDELMTYSRTFVLRDLVTELGGAPLQVTLAPALTFTAIFTGDFFQYWIRVDETIPTTSFTIDWGDGSVEEFEVVETETFHHIYAAAGNYHVSMSGDLAAMRLLSMVFGFGVTDNISLREVPGLKILTVAYSVGSAAIGADSLDLSHTPDLEELAIPHSHIRYLDISHTPKLRFIDLAGDVDLPVPVLDKLIDDLYHHVVGYAIISGTLNLEGGADNTLIGPPSQAALDQLHTIGLEYGWSILPFTP
jgi:hypothetical protein